MTRDPRRDWASYEPESIPSKSDLPELEHFLERVPRPCRVLDLGCGSGRVSQLLEGRGLDVVGVDINEAAVETARALCTDRARFHVRDICSAAGLDLEEAPFGAVVCQLVVSIVGGPADRLTLIRNAFGVLAPGGLLYLSASGVSDDINPKYRALYEADVSETEERYSYCSRDAEGNVLYVTHHFLPSELEQLLRVGGFQVDSLVTKLEASSRRPEEVAYFLYAVGSRSEQDECR